MNAKHTKEAKDTPLLELDALAEELQEKIRQKIRVYTMLIEYYIERLKGGVTPLAAAFQIMRLPDFKSNEYANLMGGDCYESQEENPMLGYRGASRCISPEFRDCFTLECQAVHRIILMVSLLALMI